MVTCYTATRAACALVANYHQKLDGVAQESKTICLVSSIVYYVWFAICVATIIVRIFAFQLLIRCYRWLARKARDKKKRKEHELERRRKDRRRRKRLLQKELTEKRNQYKILQNKIMKAIKAIAMGEEVKQDALESEKEEGKS